VNKVRSELLNGKKFHDTIVETFLSEYDGTKSFEIPKEYSFPKKPRLMQRYVAYKIKTNPYFGNFSGTGAGKTLSAILSSRVIDSKMTIIICPNDVVNQWCDDILRALLDSKVITEKPAFKIKYDENKHQYLVLNYDKFCQDDSPELILELVKQKIDFLVIDEIHFAKQRYEEAESQRRESIRALRSFVRKKNPDVKVLVMSATPVINNLTEGRSLLDLMVGKEYDDVATRATIPNAVNLHEKLTLVSVREMPKYTYKEHFLHVQAPRLPEEIRKELQKNPLQIEQYLTEARIPEIINNIKGQTIIYTEYVREIVKKLKMAVQDVGFSCAEYTGSDHSGLEMFKNGKVQVLVASKPVSTAIDGLQNNCNRLTINTLPWTRAGYEQLIGRLDRMGQTERVDVFVIKASIGGYEYDDKIKWQRIQFKRSLADCAVDGILPEASF
jgi:superfamily II DNA or RNA helicase